MNRIIAVGVIALLAVTACQPTPAPVKQTGINSYSGPTSGTKVAVLGDSLTVAASPALRAALSDTRLSISAWGHLKYTSFDVAAIKASPPAVLVVALGTNNAYDGWTNQDRKDLDQLLSATGKPACTIIVGVTSAAPVYGLDDRGQLVVLPHFAVAEYQANLAAFAAADKRTASGAKTRVLPVWETVKGPGTFRPLDGVHHTPQGSGLWATAVAKAVRAGC